MSKSAMSDQEILEKFARVVAESLRIDAARVTEDAHLDDLGAESLDLAEITMEAEEEFDVLIAQKSILHTANEVFGEGVLVRDGRLTEDGQRFLRRRLPDLPQGAEDLTVAELNKMFLQVGTWVRMIRGLMEYTPKACSRCGTALGKAVAGRLKCQSCAAEHDLQSGDDLNREWVQRYYREEYAPAKGLLPATPPASAV